MKVDYNYKLVDLFPYKIKNRENFYNRDHPVNLRPDSSKYREYWTDQWKKVIEGWWVNDEGTWVYMFPKLYFYINTAKIYDADSDNKTARKLISPRLRDNEWIIFTYLMCTLGFSGFEKDPEYTCHETVGKIEKGEYIDKFELDRLPDNVYIDKANGVYKKYVRAWDYLRIHYLITNPAKEPLGLPLYDNHLSNYLIITIRGIGKSLTVFVGDLTHEFLTGGIKYWKHRDKINESSQLFFAGSSDEKKMGKTLRMVKSFYDNMPGSYVEYNTKGEEVFTPSPFYRKLKGSWSLGNTLTHSYKTRDGRDKGSKAMIELNSIHAHDVATGDRYAYILVEEIGLLAIMFQFFMSCRDSLQVSGTQGGRFGGIGTGGDIERIQETKVMYTGPEAYNIYSIPNYWENPAQQIGLFIPIQYQNERYKDKNGNTDLELAHKYEIESLKKEVKLGTSKSVKNKLLNNPFIPSQIFHSAKFSVYPAEEALDRLVEIESEDLWRKKAAVGNLIYDKNTKYGVKFELDYEGNLTPITSYLNFDMEKDDAEGAFVMYEAPPDTIPVGLYKIIYDPVAKDGEGTSLNSLLVYKGMALDDGGGMKNTIVAEWIGRTDKLTDAWELVYKASLFYNAKIFPETNTFGFVDWMRKVKKAGSRLQSVASYVEKEVFQNYKHDPNKVGFVVRGNKGQLTFLLDNMASEWLLEEVEHDPKTGIPTKRTIDTLYSTRLLEEIAHFDPEANLDHISSLRGLMLWLANERKSKTYSIEDAEAITAVKTVVNKFLTYKRKKISIF